MFRDVILGLLRDGPPRHGYDLMMEYRARSGTHVSAGNFYRELGRLAAEGLVETGVNPPEADARRIPYQITPDGEQAFDCWLGSVPSQEDDFSSRLLFLDRVPREQQARLLDRWEETLWLRGKALAQAREDALAEPRRRLPGERYNLLPNLISRRMKQVAAELEFVKEFRLEYDAWERARRGEPNGPRAGRSAPGREKGSLRK